jgi:hypothetical protein
MQAMEVMIAWVKYDAKYRETSGLVSVLRWNRELKQATFLTTRTPPWKKRFIMKGEWWRQPFVFKARTWKQWTLYISISAKINSGQEVKPKLLTSKLAVMACMDIRGRKVKSKLGVMAC